MLETRSTEPEYLDDADCDPELSLRSYRFMEKVNRCFGGTFHVRRFIAKELKGRGISSPLRVLDIGSGSCDIPLDILRWARRKGLAVHFTCLEISPNAVEIAREKIDRERDPALDLKQEDVFTHQPVEPYDCAVASMCFHHFDDERIIALLKKLRGFVRRSVLVNDLRRSPLGVLGAAPLTAFSHAGVKHDARVSVRRGFKTGELRSLLAQLDSAAVTVKPAWLCRVCAVVRFDGEGRQ